MGLGENGLAPFLTKDKKLYVLTIDNIDYPSGMVYFKNLPAYHLFFDGKLKSTTTTSPAKAYNINKLPGFVNRQKKETGQLEFPGMEKREKKPQGGYPALFNKTKEFLNVNDLFIKMQEFDEWIIANRDKINLDPPTLSLREVIKKEFLKYCNT